MSTSCSRRQSLRFLLTLALACSLAAGSWPRPQRAADRSAVAPAEVPAQTDAGTEQRAKEAYGKLGVRFEENHGQVDERVNFVSRRGGATVCLTSDEATFVLRASQARDRAAAQSPNREEGLTEALARRGRGAERRERPQSHTVHMKFEGANPAAKVAGERELEGKVNYFRGSDPSKWLTNIKTYGAVRYRGIYDGIDIVYYGNETGEMEYDFVVAAGADPQQISLRIEGAETMEVEASGDLVIATPAGRMRQRRPEVYQEVAGERRGVEGGYVLEPGGRVRFNLGEYDRNAPLVIDPVMEYSILGDADYDEAFGIATDSSGNAYVTGQSLFGCSPDGSCFTDVFVTKFAANSNFVYSTYMSSYEENSFYDSAFGYGIAADAAGAAYVTGYVLSGGFPVVNAFQSVYGGGSSDAFVTKLSPDGSALVYSTYLGGSGGEQGDRIAVDSSGAAYVTGRTRSTDFPTANALQGAHSPNPEDAFVTKFNAAGSAVVYSTYLDGSKYDFVAGVAADSSGNAYLAGATNAADFPVVNAFQGANAGGYDAFVAKLNAAGSAFIYSTYLGGSGDDFAAGIAVDSSRSVYVAGSASSTDFPVANALQGANAGGRDVFVTRLKANGSGLVFSTYLGGSGDDSNSGIGVDSWGHATVGGHTDSTDFPLKNPLPSENFGGADAYAARIKANGSALLYSTYVGTEYEETIHDVTADPSGDAYLAGLGVDPFFESLMTETPYVAIIIKLDATLVIKGRVVTQGATCPVGVPSVTVTLAGSQTASRQTDAQGYYSFTGLIQGGHYTVTASKTGLSFVAPSRIYNNVFADVPNANFTVPALVVGNAAVTEGNTGVVTATFMVRLQPASTQPVTVNYQTAAGTSNPAVAGTDYTPRPLTQLTFDPGQTTKAVTVEVQGDTLDEPAETFRLVLSAPTNALLSKAEGVCVIMDNDPLPSLRVNNASVAEGDADVTATFTVTLSAASGQAVKVSYRTANGTATAPADYTGVGLTTLTFAPGETTKTITVTVKGDALDEAAETFKLLLSAPLNATIAAGTGTCTITDDD